MSQENVEIVRSLYAAFEAGGFDAALEFLDPEIIWEDLDALPDAGTFHGYDQLRESIGQFYDAWSDLTLAPEELIDAGDSVIVAHRWRATGKSSGTPIDTLVWNVMTVRNDKVVRRRAFLDRSQAREAAGLSE